jgi:ABC-type multidrug transport system fused ATPase/permease subunit
VTVALAVLSTVGKVLVPFVIQRTTDDGILAAGGPDVRIVLRYVLLAIVGVAVTATCTYFVNVRLFTASENGLSTLRIKAFRHIHDLSVLTQNTERRGLAGLARDVGRGHHLAVRPVRRTDAHGQRRAAAARDAAHGDLQPAARGRSSGAATSR